MDNKEIIDKLSSLIRLDIDAVQSYDAVVGKVNEQDIRETLEQFKENHNRHIESLSGIVKRLGGTPPSRGPDIKGLFFEGIALVRSLGGTEGVLRGLQPGEKTADKAYEEAMGENYPADIKAAIEVNFMDQQRQARYLENAINVRVWEDKRKAA